MAGASRANKVYILESSINAEHKACGTLELATAFFIHLLR
jgi:hypothetical protein